MWDEKVQLASDYDASALAYEQHWGPALAVLARRFLEEVPVDRVARVLDVGAGTGRFMDLLAERTHATVVGVDRSHGMLRRAPRSAVTAVMDAERLAFRDESFDAATAFFVLFHLPEPQQGLREIRRLLRSRGTFAMTTWGEDDPDFSAFDVWDEVLDRHGADEGRAFFARHEMVDTTDKCAALLEEVGIEVMSVHGERMAHEWTIEHLIGFRSRVGYGRSRWASLSDEAKESALAEGRAALEKLTPEEMTLRDEVIYTIGRAA